jgi:hypothetical protein
VFRAWQSAIRRDGTDNPAPGNGEETRVFLMDLMNLWPGRQGLLLPAANSAEGEVSGAVMMIDLGVGVLVRRGPSVYYSARTSPFRGHRRPAGQAGSTTQEEAQMRSRIMAILSALACCLGVMAGSAPAANAAPDPYCTHTRASFNDMFQTYWTAEGVGYVNWRVAANLDIYDFCDHAYIAGTVSVYAGAVKQKGGTYGVGPVYYNRSNAVGWDSRGIIFRYAYSSDGWDVFNVRTDNNIGATRGAYFDYVKVPIYLSFNDVPGAARRETCARQADNTWDCKGHMGL